MGPVVSGSICRDCESPPEPVCVSFFRVDVALSPHIVESMRRQAKDMICSRTIPGGRLVSLSQAIIIHLQVNGAGVDRRSFVTATIGLGKDHVPVACTTNILMQGQLQ